MSQKTDNLIKLALVFFVSLLSFSIGTYVGKKYSDNQHKLSLLEPKKDVPAPQPEEFASDQTPDAEKPVAAAPHAATTEEPTSLQQKPAALTDSEVAKIAEEFANEEDATEEKIVSTIQPEQKDVKTVTVAGKAVAKTEAAPVVKPGAKVEALPAKVAPKVVETKPVVEERVPASIPEKPEVTPLHFTVQIGSFPTQDEAIKMTKALQNKGYKTSFVPAKVNGQFWYRVNVGLFGSIREAQDYKKEFLEKTSLTSAIVQRVQE